jgi:hypothetical protein
MRPWLLCFATTAIAVFAGCGATSQGTTSSASPATNTATSATTAPPGPDADCSTSYPHRLTVSGYLADLVVVCAGKGGATVTNDATSLAISVTISGPSTFSWSVSSPTPIGFVDEAVDNSVDSACHDGAPCTVGPGVTLTVQSTPPLRIGLGVAVNATAAVTATGVIANWIAEHVTPGGQLLSQAEKCGQDAERAASATDANDAVREALQGGFDCDDAIRTVNADINESDDDVAVKDEADRALELANRFTERLHSDFANIAIVSLLDHFH